MSTMQAIRAGRLNALKDAGVPANVVRLEPKPRTRRATNEGPAQILLFEPRPRQKLLEPRYRIPQVAFDWSEAPLIEDSFDDIEARDVQPLAA